MYGAAYTSKYSCVWREAATNEFEGFNAAGSSNCSAKIPEGPTSVGAKWMFKWRSNEKERRHLSKVRQG